MHINSPAKAINKHSWRNVYSILTLICLLFLASACSSKKVPEPEIPPGVPVNLKETPEFFAQNLTPQDQRMKSWRELEPSISKSLEYVREKPKSAKAIQRRGLTMTWGEMEKTLVRLQSLLPRLDAEPDLFSSNFEWIPIKSGIMYSGYYSPVVKASYKRKKGYNHPIYRRPPELRDGNKYFTRREIEAEQKIANRGLELAWAADQVDVFFLEIQGSGCLLLDDGSQICINYAGQNGHKYKSSGKIMREKGLLKRGDIFEQRQWLKDHPDRVNEILHDNPSFVFFKLGGSGPTGAMGFVVDDWKSLATDRSFIPLGSIVAYGVNIPDKKWGRVPLRGIGFAQDVGGAIKKNRIDIYCGSDDRANYVASFLDAKGPAWVLRAK